ncbi:hypothetical protein OAG1_42110 [Agarivorans sp. OAG1]|uniref:hypothetical protein n=1 Tax=Agarivorans sp. OAG1 TaxID=3082387 RepID=UPI002B319EB5|nr:hypothetical protein OAG1_42110 [Agarivorans sp. OAG1]
MNNFILGNTTKNRSAKPKLKERIVKKGLLLTTVFAASTAFPSQAEDLELHPVYQRNSYFSLTGGSGVTHIDHAENSEQKKQQFRSFDVRFGQYITDSLRVDFVHANEGHPYNHHRDGFAVQATYTKAFTNKFRLELGAGPYASFDTTVDQNGTELNEKRMGVMNSAAFVYSFNHLGSGAHLRLQWNNYLMSARPNGNSVLVGFGVDFDNQTNQAKVASDSLFNEVWLSWAHTKINHGGPDTTSGYSIEAAHRFSNNLALSVGWLDEGGDNGSTDRQGITAQFWSFVPLGNHLEGRFGLGPYFAQDKYEHSSAIDIKGVFTIGLNYYPHWVEEQKLFLAGSLTRVVDRNGYEDDADVARLTLGYKF